MIDVTSHTTKSTRLRKVKKTKENLNGTLSKGETLTNGSTHHTKDDSELDRSWNVMNYSDYVDYSRLGEENVSLCDTLFGSSLFGFDWDLLSEVTRRRSGGSTLNTSKAFSPTSPTTNEDGSDSAGFIFRYYRKFGFYWNVFPKTDYCYLPSSPDYRKEVSPGIPKVPNLSRHPLSSYIRRGVAVQRQHESSRLSESRLDSSTTSLTSSTKLDSAVDNTLPTSNWSSIEARQNLINNSLRRTEERSSWTKVKRLTQTIVRVITRTVRTTVTTVTHVTSSVVSSNQSHHGAESSRSKLPFFIFLVFLLPLLYYFLIPGLIEASQDEKITAVSNKASNMFFWSSGYISSALNLVKESLLYIPTLFFQLAAIFHSGNTNSSKNEPPCADPPAAVISSVPQFPLMNLSNDLSEEKMLAFQTEIIEKLKTELAGRDHHLTSRIEQIQEKMSQLTEDMKKMSNQMKGDGWKNNFQKLEVELAGLKKAVIEVKDQAVGSVASPSQKMVEMAVAKYHADRTGKPDYALQSSGGYVVRVRCAQTYTRTTANVYVLGIPLPWDVFNGPETIIKPGVMPGECWAFEGSFAQVTLHLATKVKITGFSLEHSPRELALHGHISSAPKQFSVWALESENDENPVFLGRFTFLDNGESLQEFEAIEYDQLVSLIDLKIESNHGHPEYTCLYRFRVHGVPPPV